MMCLWEGGVMPPNVYKMQVMQHPIVIVLSVNFFNHSSWSIWSKGAVQ